MFAIYKNHCWRIKQRTDSRKSFFTKLLGWATLLYPRFNILRRTYLNQLPSCSYFRNNLTVAFLQPVLLTFPQEIHVPFMLRSPRLNPPRKLWVTSSKSTKLFRTDPGDGKLVSTATRKTLLKSKNIIDHFKTDKTRKKNSVTTEVLPNKWM